jgi:hypothetical protein
VESKSIAELTQVDEFVRRLGPLGLNMAGMMSDTDAVEYHQQTIAGAELTEAVPESTRRSFERLRMLHTYGAFCYDLYTVANDQSLLVLEQALGERFIDFYGGTVEVVRETDQQVAVLQAGNYEEVFDSLQTDGRTPARNGWRLRLRSSAELLKFNGYLRDLFIWARREGLLVGQRSRRLDPLLVSMRNGVAHGRVNHLLTPMYSSRAIWQTAEIINQLWGASTPGGRYSPAPIPRKVLAIGWEGADPPTNWTLLRGDQLVDARSELHDWTFILVRGIENDEGLWNFRSRFELCNATTDYLAGPCSWQDAQAWVESNGLDPDAVTILDRLFLVRQLDGKLEWARRPEVFAALPETEQLGSWHLLRADNPGDAVTHVRGGPWGVEGDCASSGHCFRCAVESLACGDWTTVRQRLMVESPQVVPSLPPDVSVPGRWPVA